MDNLLTYLKFRGDVSFKSFKFCELDGMLLSVIAGLDYDGLFEKREHISVLSNAYFEKNNKDYKDERLSDKEEVLKLIGTQKRFKNLYVEDYVKIIDKEKEMTFYAMTFSLSKFDYYVVFRGTDGSLLSWKENFSTLYLSPSNGQYEAVSYLAKQMKRPFSRFTVIGHSKGGNLAVYAAMQVFEKYQKRIVKVYSFDAPGYIEDISEKLSFLRIKDRIEAIVPESCVIGNLMLPPYEKRVVKSHGNGVYQHDLFNWEAGPSGLLMAESTNEFSAELSKKINDWVVSISVDDRERVVNELFDMFEKNGINHITDLMHFDLRKILGLIKAATSLSSENRALLSIIIKQLRASH